MGRGGWGRLAAALLALLALPAKGGHLKVRLGDRQSVMPMHGSSKKLKTGTVEAIKKQLGLK